MKLSDPTLLSCWPDGYSRYYSVCSILHLVFGESKKLSILDVGGDSKWMADFLDGSNLSYALNIVDTRKPDFKNKRKNVTYTQGDFFALDKASHQSDVVINTDVLEHIPQDLKIPFVNQCMDFADSLVILSAPQDDTEVTFAEKQINKHYENTSGKQQRWLKEHFEFGKPSASKIEAAIKDRNLSYICVNTNNLENWLLSFGMNLINSEVAGLEGMDEFNRFYNKNIHEVGDFSGKPYRKIFVVFKDSTLYDKHHKKIADYFAPGRSKKIEFLAKSVDLLVNNLSALQHNHSAEVAKYEKEYSLLQKNLKQTQEAFVATSKELDAIKASRSYRYTSKVKRTLRR